LKLFGVILVWRPGFGVNCGVLVAKFIVSPCCKVRFPIELKHFGLLWCCYSISRQGTVWSKRGDWVSLQKQLPPPHGLRVFKLKFKADICPSEFSSLD
jgi:hypothetical protein